MLYSRSFHLLLFLFLIFHFPISFGVEPVNHFCFNTQKFTSPYKTNLKNLLYELTTKSPSSRFGTGRSGSGLDTIYGLVLCNADISSNDCKKCISEAGSTLQERCKDNKGAIIWYDSCLLKYSDTEFFGQIDYLNQFVGCNQENVSMDFETFNNKSIDLVTKLSAKADGESRKFAKGKLDLGNKTTLYGMALCTRDLSKDYCKQCLESGILQIPTYCYGKKGSRTVSGSCIARYELYPF